MDNDFKKNLDSLKTSIAATQEKIQEVKANDDMQSMCSKMEYMMQEMGYIYRYASAVEDMVWKYMEKHSKGHLPPIVGAERMQKALKSIGMDGDYDVIKSVIFASKKQGELVVDYKKDK
jgi:hypothetical protein